MPPTINELKPIPPNPPRWKPSIGPTSITVTGLDTTASVNDQIDQIDQLITLKLQDIDADFSGMQQVLSNRILPAFKRYSIGTEPVREAAKFWTSFYEQAAQVRIPTYDDFSSLQEPSSGAPLDEPTTVPHPEDLSIASESNLDPFDPNRTPSEGSFLPSHAAVSSTPAAATARTRGANDTSFTPQPPIADPSWSASIESPLVRLGRDLREFARADPQPASTSTSIFSEADLTAGTITANAADETVQAPPAPTPSTIHEPKPTVRTHAVPPLVFRPKPATPARNPYLPAHSDPRDWSGIVDLRSSQPVPSLSETDEDATLPMGMSPPVMVPFATLPTLGRSPAKNAAANIRRALIREGLRAAGGDSSISASGSGSSPTPPSLARYTRGASTSQSSASLRPDLELDSMMRRVELPQDSQHWWHSSAASASASASASFTSIPDNSHSTPSYYTTPILGPTPGYTHEVVNAPPPETPVPASGAMFPAAGGASTSGTEGVAASIDATPESDDGSTPTSTFSSSGEDSVHDTAHPSAAFLLASRQRGRHDYDDHDDDDEPDDDDDFDDSLDADADAALAPVHPFARARALSAQDVGTEYDDSFDSLEGGDGDEGGVPEETVFGVRPAEREAAQPRLRMLGEDLLQDTIGIGTQLARAGRVEESPTPWGGGGGGKGG
ncbi:hypothetical protein BJV78DRAFT_124399 [Lactifluus subvellereus]|nr:hypothetical protein BJV78DRAFT_124399 [Lactifluus subvellereus]